MAIRRRNNSRFETISELLHIWELQYPVMGVDEVCIRIAASGVPGDRPSHSSKSLKAYPQ
jgi:hypothetical protein